MGSPSRNVQYHPPRLSEDRLNLPQPHSPSLPTHCTAPGNRECAHADYRVHVSFQLRDKRDGELLEGLKGLDGTRLGLPEDPDDWPMRDYLERRFTRYRETLE